jgi:3',5'-nucleoside bisphosphate phosphatase
LDCKQAGIDLHIHSNASDGTFSPREILCKAERIGLKAISITDHDTLSGVVEALDAGIPESIRFLTGVEISAGLPPDFEFLGNCHLLGYGIDPEDPGLAKTLGILRKARKTRNPRIIKKLNALHIDITMEEVLADAAHEQAGRPHIAKTMTRKCIVSSINEAFDKYLSRGRPAYVDKYRIEFAEAIRIIRDSGGIPVLAHPFLLNHKSLSVFKGLITALRDMGLMGIEVYYPGHPPEVSARFADIARRLDLLITGGTDFHGKLTPDIHMGMGKGDLFVPYELYEKLIAVHRNRHAGKTNFTNSDDGTNGKT